MNLKHLDLRLANNLENSAKKWYDLFKSATNPCVKRRAGLKYLRNMADVRSLRSGNGLAS